MFGISLPELVVIAFAALLILGPNELPVVLKKIGTLVGQLKSLANQFMEEINREVDSPKKYIKDLNGKMQETYDIEDLIDMKKKEGDKK